MRRNSSRVQRTEALELKEQNEVKILGRKRDLKVGEVSESVAFPDGFADRGKDIEGRISLTNASRQASAVPGLHWISTMTVADDGVVCAASVFGRNTREQKTSRLSTAKWFGELTNLRLVIGTP